MWINLKRPNYKYLSCHLVGRHLTFPVTTTRYIPWVEFVFPSEIWPVISFMVLGCYMILFRRKVPTGEIDDTCRKRGENKKFLMHFGWKCPKVQTCWNTDARQWIEMSLASVIRQLTCTAQGDEPSVYIKTARSKQLNNCALYTEYAVLWS